MKGKWLTLSDLLEQVASSDANELAWAVLVDSHNPEITGNLSALKVPKSYTHCNNFYIIKGARHVKAERHLSGMVQAITWEH